MILSFRQASVGLNLMCRCNSFSLLTGEDDDGVLGVFEVAATVTGARILCMVMIRWWYNQLVSEGELRD